MPPSRPGPSNKSIRGAYKSTETPGLRIAKAARKLQYSTESESSDRCSSATASGSQYEGESSFADFSDTDSDVFQRPLNRDARPTYVAKRAKQAARKVNFDVPKDSDSDDAMTVRGEPSPRRHRQNLPEQHAIPRAPPSVNRKQSGTNKTQGARRHVPNVDVQRLVKSTRVNAFRGKKVKRWGSKFTRKGNKIDGRRYARMSIGTSSQRGSSQNTLAPSVDRRRRWFFRTGGIASRRNRTYDRESESESDEQEVHQPLPQRASKTVRVSQSATKSARPLAVPSHESDIEGPSDSGESFPDDDDFLGGPIDDCMPDAFGEENSVYKEPSQALLDGLERLTSSVVRLDKMRRLPFLRRNLRRGFQLHCRIVGIDSNPHPLPHTSVPVIYSGLIVNDASGEGTHNTIAKSSMKGWLCPLCDLYKKFQNPRMLDKHLAWDHSSVRVLWGDQYTALSLTIPGPPSESNPLVVHPVPVGGQSAPTLPSDPRHEERSTSADSDLKSLVRTSSTPSGATSESRFSASTIPTSVEREDVKQKYDVSGYLDQSLARTQSRSSSMSGRSVSRVLSSVDAQGGLGPSLVSPYLPETPDERGDVFYSCRPGGPRLYDLLNPLPLKDFGVLKWVVIDREEELFEIDNILDEDKVMQALWFRWIFLNRNRFVANYFDGAKAFIKENWVLIEKGAGLPALRVLLLVLAVNNFLLPVEVAGLMKYYQELANARL